MTKEQKAKNMAESEFNVAESIADQRGLKNGEKWSHICGSLQHKIEELYLEVLA